MDSSSSSSSMRTNESNEKNESNDTRLVDIPVTDENTSLNLIVSFLILAQKRGTFSIDESAKIWECIQIFQRTK
jgi:hypothetical protein